MLGRGKGKLQREVEAYFKGFFLIERRKCRTGGRGSQYSCLIWNYYTHSCESSFMMIVNIFSINVKYKLDMKLFLGKYN